MHQTICVAILLSVAALLNAPLAAKMAADGNWGEAAGRMFAGPIIVFYIVHTLVYYVMRLMRGRTAISTYAASRLNYIAFTITLLGILGAVARYARPPS